MRSIALFIVSVLAGCSHLSIEQRTPNTVTPITVEVSRLPVGSPTVTLDHPDGSDQWQVHVGQQYSITTESRIPERQVARRYLWWPLSPLSGLLQCPIGSLISAFSRNNPVGSIGCYRLLGLEPLGNVATLSTTTKSSAAVTTQAAPLMGAHITIQDPRSQEIVQRTQTDRAGNASFHTYSRQEADTSSSEIILAVAQGNHTISERRVVTPSSQTWSPPADQVTTIIQWPSPAIFQVITVSERPDQDEISLRNTVQASLLRAGHCVVGLNQQIGQIQDEQRLQYVGRIADQTAIRPGRLLAPTVLIEITRMDQNQNSEIVMTVKDVKRGSAIGIEQGKIQNGEMGRSNNSFFKEFTRHLAIKSPPECQPY